MGRMRKLLIPGVDKTLLVKDESKGCRISRDVALSPAAPASAR